MSVVMATHSTHQHHTLRVAVLLWNQQIHPISVCSHQHSTQDPCGELVTIPLLCLFCAALPSGLKHLEASGCGLSGPLPDLPARLTRIDVADNQLTGSVTNINVTSMEVRGAKDWSYHNGSVRFGTSEHSCAVGHCYGRMAVPR